MPEPWSPRSRMTDRTSGPRSWRSWRASPRRATMLVVDDLDELLARGDGAQDLLALGLLDGGVDEAADHPEVDVRLQQGELDLLDRLLDVLLADGRLSADRADYVSEFLGKPFEHRGLMERGWVPGRGRAFRGWEYVPAPGGLV
ncbi:MAG: hypothetical protein MZV64_09825 [Ignavibacteriales bacterium]|nr:hypothetical protein [Ignavibacteriales bacterium]